MIRTFDSYNNNDIQKLIMQSVSQLDKNQQIKLLEFINSLFIPAEKESNPLLQFAGCIDADELNLMKTAISDCDKIDHNEW